MKKLISIVMALMMAMFAVSALAESPAAAYSGELGISVSQEGIAAIMSMTGSDLGSQESVMNAVVSIVNSVSLRGVMVGKEAQAELLLKDEALASFYAKK